MPASPSHQPIPNDHLLAVALPAHAHHVLHPADPCLSTHCSPALLGTHATSQPPQSAPLPPACLPMHLLHQPVLQPQLLPLLLLLPALPPSSCPLPHGVHAVLPPALPPSHPLQLPPQSTLQLEACQLLPLHLQSLPPLPPHPAHPQVHDPPPWQSSPPCLQAHHAQPYSACLPVHVYLNPPPSAHPLLPSQPPVPPGCATRQGNHFHVGGTHRLIKLSFDQIQLSLCFTTACVTPSSESPIWP